VNWRVAWTKYYDAVIAVLVAALIVAATGALFRAEILSARLLADNKPVVDVASMLLGAAVLLLGAVASYIRFFRGRTLSPRVNLRATASVFPIDERSHLQVLDVELENSGSSAIWDIEPTVDIIYHAPVVKKEQGQDDWIRTQDCPEGNAPTEMLDTGVTGNYVWHREVAVDVWAVTYSIQVKHSGGHVWYRVITVSNRLGSAGE
jgi:hypothetical protein